MGLRAQTDERGIKIWCDTKGDYPRYSFSIGKKNDSGSYDNFYMEVKFKKDLVAPNNGDEIIIKDSFLSFNVWTGKDGKKHTSPYLMIQDFDMLSGGAPAAIVDIPDDADEEMPFK